MPRKLKVIVDVDAPTNLNDSIKVGDATIEIVVSLDVPEVLPEAPEKIKKR